MKRCKEIDRIKERLTTKAGAEELKNHFYFDSVKALMHEIHKTTDDQADAFIECCEILTDIEDNDLLTKDDISALSFYNFAKSLEILERG